MSTSNGTMIMAIINKIRKIIDGHKKDQTGGGDIINSAYRDTYNINKAYYKMINSYNS